MRLTGLRPLVPALLLAFASQTTVADSGPAPPDHVRGYWDTPGIVIDWAANTVPVPPGTVAYEVWRTVITPGVAQVPVLIGMVPPSMRTFVDTTADRTQWYSYCVKDQVMGGRSGPCSDPIYIINAGDCLYLSTGGFPNTATVYLDSQCLFTTDPPLSPPYPYCAPVYATIQLLPSVQPTAGPRDYCVQPVPLPPGT